MTIYKVDIKRRRTGLGTPDEIATVLVEVDDEAEIATAIEAAQALDILKEAADFEKLGPWADKPEVDGVVEVMAVAPFKVKRGSIPNVIRLNGSWEARWPSPLND